MAIPSGYILSEAQEMMTLAAASYAGEDIHEYYGICSAVEEVLPKLDLLDDNFRLVWLGVSADFGNLMMVVRDRRAPERYAVVVRGTDWKFLSNWEEDLNVVEVERWPTAQPPDHSIRISRGAWDGFCSVGHLRSEIFEEAVAGRGQVNLQEFFQKQAAELPKGADLEIYITGHSLGGVLATLVGLRLAEAAAEWNIAPGRVWMKTYTFASPTVGNQAFADYYNGQCENPDIVWESYRLFNHHDPVPRTCGELEHLREHRIPSSKRVELEWRLLISTIHKALILAGVEYVHVGSVENGTARPLTDEIPEPVPGRSVRALAHSLEDFALHLGEEHQVNCYLRLLRAPEINEEMLR